MNSLAGPNLGKKYCKRLHRFLAKNCKRNPQSSFKALQKFSAPEFECSVGKPGGQFSQPQSFRYLLNE
jgi:hypothetical protein